VKEFSELLPEPVVGGANSCGPPVYVSKENLFFEKRAPAVNLSLSVMP
jgi:hypothetical protein